MTNDEDRMTNGKLMLVLMPQTRRGELMLMIELLHARAGGQSLSSRMFLSGKAGVSFASLKARPRPAPAGLRYGLRPSAALRRLRLALGQSLLVL